MSDNEAAAPAAGAPVPVTPDNFVRAESDRYLGNLVRESEIGKLFHRREPAAIDNQTVIRLNRDTLYSSAVFDLDAGPVTITLPDAGKRFMSMQVIDEDEYTPEVAYGAGTQTLTKDKVGTRYVVVGCPDAGRSGRSRKTWRPSMPSRTRSRSTSRAARATFEVPDWDQASQKKVRDALLVAGRDACPTPRACSGRRARSIR